MTWRPVLIIIVIAFMFAGVSVYPDEFTYDYQKILPVEEPVALDLEIGRGSVNIIGSEDNRIIIEAVKHVRAGSEDEAQEVADHIEIKVRQKGKAITIKTNYLRFSQRGEPFLNKLSKAGSDTYGSVDYTISVPTAIDITINSLIADIDLSSVEGKINIVNEMGSTSGEFLFGPITISQRTGSIDLQWIEGDVRIKSSTGKVTINQVRGAIDVTTLTSNVAIKTELNSPRDFFVKTNSGEVVFSVPENSSGKLNIETETGRIRTDVPVTIRSIDDQRIVGEFGQGGPSINISSLTGDVRVAQF